MTGNSKCYSNFGMYFYCSFSLLFSISTEKNQGNRNITGGRGDKSVRLRKRERKVGRHWCEIAYFHCHVESSFCIYTCFLLTKKTHTE